MPLKEVQFPRTLSSLKKKLLSTKNFFHSQTSYPQERSFKIYLALKILFGDKTAENIISFEVEKILSGAEINILNGGS